MSCHVHPEELTCGLVRAGSQTARSGRDIRGAKPASHTAQPPRAATDEKGRAATADTNPFSTPDGWRMMFRLKPVARDVNPRRTRCSVNPNTAANGHYHTSRARSSGDGRSGRFRTRQPRGGSLISSRHELVETFSTAPAAKDFHAEHRVKKQIPELPLGVTDVDGEALRAAHMLACGILFHDRISYKCSFSEDSRQSRNTAFRERECVVALKRKPIENTFTGGKKCP